MFFLGPSLREVRLFYLRFEVFTTRESTLGLTGLTFSYPWFLHISWKSTKSKNGNNNIIVSYSGNSVFTKLLFLHNKKGMHDLTILNLDSSFIHYLKEISSSVLWQRSPKNEVRTFIHFLIMFGGIILDTRLPTLIGLAILQHIYFLLLHSKLSWHPQFVQITLFEKQSHPTLFLSLCFPLFPFYPLYVNVPFHPYNPFDLVQVP